MKSVIYWIQKNFPGRIALVPRPRGNDWLEDEVSNWKDESLNIIVSMLESEEIETFGLEKEKQFCNLYGIDFFSIPVRDRSIPILNNQFLTQLEDLKTQLSQGKNIGIHCRQSIGRASLLAAFLMSLFEIEPAEAFYHISMARGLEVPETLEQKNLVEKFYKETSVALV